MRAKKTLTIHVLPEILANVDSQARANGLTRAELVRRCLNAGWKTLVVSGDMKVAPTQEQTP